MCLIDLRRAVSSPPQSTMRLRIRSLTEEALLTRERQSEFPSTVQYRTSPAGESLTTVGTAVGNWLARAPCGVIALGSPGAKSAITSLIEAWSTNIVRALAARPLSLTELNPLIPAISYPALERRVSMMRLTDLIEAREGHGRRTPYAPTRWLREAVAPLTAAALWEQRYAKETPSISRIDIECILLLTIPLIDLPAEANGTCRLVAEVQGGPDPVYTGVMASVEKGRIVSCSSRLEGPAAASVSGNALDWMRRLSGMSANSLEFRGDPDLVDALSHGLLRLGSTPS